MNLFVKGDDHQGYWVELGSETPLLTSDGVFSAVFEDPATGVQQPIRSWRAQAASKSPQHVLLTGRILLTQIHAEVSVEVLYEITKAGLLKQEILCTSDTNLSYALSVKWSPLGEPEGYWTFEQSNHSGGPIYEVYPAMGMTVGGQTYGFLTDSGYRNRWTRVSRQTDGLGFLVGLEQQPDAELMTMATLEERVSGEHYVQYKFGEFLDFTERKYETTILSPQAAWQPLSSSVRVYSCAELLRVAGSESGVAGNGVALPITLDKNELYEVSFRYRSQHPLSLRLLDAENESYFEWSKEYGAYRDGIPATVDNEWKSFQKHFFSSRFPNLKQRLILKIMQDPGFEAPCDFELADVQIRRYVGVSQPFHTLLPSKPQRIRLFVFEERPTSHRNLQIASQVRLAEGLGFDGTEEEKILYADNQMLVWIAQHNNFAPHVVPSLNYHPDMYLRDTFWEVHAVHDKAVAEGCWERYATTQHTDGQLDTLARAYRYAPSRDDNDATMFFLMWAYVNQQRYGSQPDMEPLKKALSNIRLNHCPNRDGRYTSRTAGWFDTIWGAPTVSAINQGHFAVTLRCAKALGLDVEEDEIWQAKAAYRELYNPMLGYVQWSKDADYLSPSVLMGEFMNLWLFDEPILSDDVVIKTVEKLPVIKRGVPCIADRHGRLFTDENKPWEEKYTWRQGVYHNGGSWFLYEYLAYAAAARHGWVHAAERMNWRLKMEFSKEDEPYSHEFIPLTDDVDDWWPSCRVFGWNTFALVANQVAKGVYEH